MKLQRPINTEPLQPTWLYQQPNYGDRGRDGAKGAEWQHKVSVATHNFQITAINKPLKIIFILEVYFGVYFRAIFRNIFRDMFRKSTTFHQYISKITKKK